MSPQHSPLISVVIPAYNAAAHLERAIASIKAQTYQHWEIVVIDDGSTDNSWELLKSLRTESIRALQQTNQGPAAARNHGIREAKGEYITFLDADDEFPETKLQLQAQHLITHPELFFVSGKIKYILNEGHQVKEYLFEDTEQQTMTNVNFGAMMMRSSAFDPEVIGMIDEEMTYAEDVDWWLRALEQKVPFEILPEVTLHYHLHDTNMTNKLHENTRFFAMALRRSLRRRRAAGNHGALPNLHNFIADDTQGKHPEILALILEGPNKPSSEGLLRSIAKQDYQPTQVVYFKKDPALEEAPHDFEGPLEVAPNGSFQNRLELLKSEDQESIQFVALGCTGTKWNRKRLNAQINYLLNHPYEDACTCRVQVASEGSNKISGTYFEHGSPIQSMVIRKNAIHRIGITDEDGQIKLNTQSLNVKELKLVLIEVN